MILFNVLKAEDDVNGVCKKLWTMSYNISQREESWRCVEERKNNDVRC